MNGTWHLRSSKGSGTYELPTGNIEWPHPASGRHGAAVFSVPRGHTAEALVEQRMWATYIDDALGTWPGRVVVPPSWQAGVVEVQCLHVSYLFMKRRCYFDSELVGLTPGGVVRAAFRAAFGDGADGHIVLGNVLEAPPTVVRYSLTGQPFDAVLTDMEKLSGQTWAFKGDTFHWVADTDSLYPYVLMQDGDFFMESSGPVERGDQVGQVIARDSLGRVVASPAVSLSVTDEQEEITLGTVSLSELQEAADVEVARRAHPTTVFTFVLKDAPYGASDDPRLRSGGGRIPLLMVNRSAVSAFEHRRRIREGSVIRFVAPRSRTGDAGLGKVLSRTHLGETGLIEVQVEYLFPFDASTAAAAGRGVARGPLPRPPSAPGPAVNGKVRDEDVESLDARKVKGRVAEAARAESANSATTAASATTAGSAGSVPATGVQPGDLPNGVKPRPEDMRTGSFPSGVVISGSDVSGAVASATTATTAGSATTATTATTANGVAAGAVGTAGLQNQAVSTDTSGFSTETSPTLSAGSATAIPGDPVTWVWVKDAGGTLRKVPAW